jgi:hypothetical protein
MLYLQLLGFFFSLFLLTYNSLQGDTLCYLHMCLQCILVKFTPPSFSLVPLPTSLKNFGFILLFSYIKYITIFAVNHLFLMPSSLPLIPPQKRPVLSSSFIFKKCMLTVQGCFTLALDILCFTQVNFPLLTLSLSPCSPLFNSL